MNFNPLDAISPVDGRYRKTCESLSGYFSEAALMRYRVKIEASYFLALCSIPLPQLKKIDARAIEAMENLVKNFRSINVTDIKEIEKVTNHDVKAVEYFIKKSNEDVLLEHSEFVHFGLTSQDINNTAIPLSVKDAMEEVLLPSLNELRELLISCAEQWRSIPLLAHTHGQPASPTGLGKEIAVFINRIDEQIKQLKNIPWSAKFGGATGNFNAHIVTYPDVDWQKFGDDFVKSLGLIRSRITTQIEHYDNLAALFDLMKRINTILMDLSRDMWSYISMNYFTQHVAKGEIGSSAMPHKVNPIDFENAEGNFGIANALFTHFSSKLPVSRLQRDLTDSTVLRNTGVPFSHTLIGYKSLIKGLKKITVNKAATDHDLENNWAVVAEALQTILRRENYPNPYEALLDLTRTGEKITREKIHTFINELKIDDKVKSELLKITPHNYVGNAFSFTISDK